MREKITVHLLDTYMRIEKIKLDIRISLKYE